MNKVVICGVDTSKLPHLKGKEKRDLFDRVMQGDLVARDDFIFANLRLVLSIVQKFISRNENLDDIFQVGCVGLIKAIDNFDTRHGVQFSTYAVPMIIGEIRRYLRDNNSIRVARSLKDIAYKALQFKEHFINENSREPTSDEIAKKLEITREEVVIALDAMQDPVSLFEPVYSDGTDAIFVMDTVKDEKNSDTKWAETLSINQGLEKLAKREREIIDLRFFKGRTQTEIAEEIGISQAQVSRLEKNAIKAMKKYVD